MVGQLIDNVRTDRLHLPRQSITALSTWNLIISIQFISIQFYIHVIHVPGLARPIGWQLPKSTELIPPKQQQVSRSSRSRQVTNPQSKEIHILQHCTLSTLSQPPHHCHMATRDLCQHSTSHHTEPSQY